MARRRTKLDVIAAIDADVFHQVVDGVPANDHARDDYDVFQALQSVYSEVRAVPVHDDLVKAIETIEQHRPDAVFNLACSASDQESFFVGYLDYLGVRYTGSGPLGIALANDKVRSRHLLSAAGLTVPEFVELPFGSRRPRLAMDPPMLVKPARFTGCSFGIYQRSLVDTPKAAMVQVRQLWDRYGIDVMCDSFIPGREFRVGIVKERPSGIRVLGVTECLFPTAKPGWGFKNRAVRINPRVRRARKVRSVPVDLPGKLRKELDHIAETTMRVLSLDGYASLDIRMDRQESLWIVDVNANPTLAARSGIWGRPSFEANIRKIVRAAL